MDDAILRLVFSVPSFLLIHAGKLSPTRVCELPVRPTSNGFGARSIQNYTESLNTSPKSERKDFLIFLKMGCDCLSCQLCSINKSLRLPPPRLPYPEKRDKNSFLHIYSFIKDRGFKNFCYIPYIAWPYLFGIL